MAFPEGSDSAEDLNASGDSDDHSGCSEVGSGIDVESDGIHVVASDDEPEDSNGCNGVDHAELTEDRLSGEGGSDMADDSEGWQDEDVDFRVAEESEEVLEEQRVATVGAIVEGGAEVPISEEHSNATG